MHAPTTGLEVAELQSIFQVCSSRPVGLCAACSRRPATPEAGVDPVASTDVPAKAAKLDEELKKPDGAPSLPIFRGPRGEKRGRVLGRRGTPLGLGRIDVNPGHHAIVATLEGRQVSKEVDLHESDDVAIPCSSMHPSLLTAGDPAGEATADGRARQGLPKVAYIGFGVGAAGMVVGGVTGVLALMAKKVRRAGVRREPLSPSRRLGWRLNERALSKASTASMIGGAAGVGLAIGSLFMQKKPKVVGGNPPRQCRFFSENQSLSWAGLPFGNFYRTRRARRGSVAPLPRLLHSVAGHLGPPTEGELYGCPNARQRPRVSSAYELRVSGTMGDFKTCRA